MPIRLSDSVHEGDHVRWQSDSLVMLVEYGDFECAYSGQAYYIIRQLHNDLDGHFNFVFRNFPLIQIRPHSLPAALAAEAAGWQNNFWEMHDLMFEQQHRLGPEYLLAFAQVLGMDIEQFIIDMTSDEAAARVRRDFVGGIQSGVSVTPTFYIDGQRHDGAHDLETLKKIIEKATAAKNPRTALASRLA